MVSSVSELREALNVWKRGSCSSVQFHEVVWNFYKFGVNKFFCKYGVKIECANETH